VRFHTFYNRMFHTLNRVISRTP